MVKDVYGCDAGPDGFGTELPPAKGWSLFGYFENEKEARMAVQVNRDNDEPHRYKIHPHNKSAVIWANREKDPRGGYNLDDVPVTKTMRDAMKRMKEAGRTMMTNPKETDALVVIITKDDVVHIAKTHLHNTQHRAHQDYEIEDAEELLEMAKNLTQNQLNRIASVMSDRYRNEQFYDDLWDATDRILPRY